MRGAAVLLHIDEDGKNESSFFDDEAHQDQFLAEKGQCTLAVAGGKIVRRFAYCAISPGSCVEVKMVGNGKSSGSDNQGKAR